MSYALESKKRKFHRVLESISKPPPPSNVSKPTAPAAQDRLPANLSIKKVRLSSNDNSDLASVRNSILKATRSSSTSSSKRSTFAPWDRECFLERLETFRRVDRWTSKPAPINEVQWAKRGWICTDVMRVSCIGNCGGSVLVKLPEEIDELDGYDAEKVQERNEVREFRYFANDSRSAYLEFDRAYFAYTGARLVEEYVKQLTDGHRESCPWRRKGCDATIQHLPLTNTDTTFSELQDRYLDLVKMGDKLPAENAIQTPDDFDVDGIISMLPKDWSKDSEGSQQPGNRPETTSEPSTEAAQANPETSAPKTPERQKAPQPFDGSPNSINRTALALAFFGWNVVADGTAGLVACKACFRRLGLWMYKPKANGDVTVYSSLDVEAEHMEYCPWVNRVAQSGSGKPNEKADDLRSGWELVAQAVKVKHRRRIRSVRSMDTLSAEPMTPSSEFMDEEVDEEAKKKTEREWWAKIRRVRQVLKSKSPHRKTTRPK
ncbi:hypothetical protein N7492_005824 [Penicillium capsulatum]|uniref:C3HC-type domain-containing protein n=1 Tax=Penicillium capsulatum TaxID=69766 RepID=A0A9W9LS15_9EURO|nr:hypothetical protein N7492_005824 [Penicillium capsulatum]KAJ6135076.1 hypothetical protein N7512_000236 [Penicillium capsulatum]